MLMIQAEAQLRNAYGEDAQTIIGSCDTYVYLGGNDVETARNIAQRVDLPLGRILYMPVGTNWIFRRGQQPVEAKNFDLDTFAAEKLRQPRRVNEEFYGSKREGGSDSTDGLYYSKGSIFNRGHKDRAFVPRK